MGKTLLFNGEENCHPVSFRFVPETNQLVALFFFEEEYMLEDNCLVIVATGEEYVRNRDQMLDQTEPAYIEQIDPEVVEAIEKRKGWKLMVMNYSEQLKPAADFDENLPF